MSDWGPCDGWIKQLLVLDFVTSRLIKVSVSVISLGPRLAWSVKTYLEIYNAKPAEKNSKLRRRITTPWGQSIPDSCSLAPQYRERSLIPFRRFLSLYKQRNVSFTYNCPKETRSENIPDGSVLSLLSFKYLQEKKWQLICVSYPKYWVRSGQKATPTFSSLDFRLISFFVSSQ